MGFKGTVKGRTIEMDGPLPYGEGTRVDVAVTPESRARKGSPKAILQLAGTLTEEEADRILRAARDCRQVDRELW